MVNDSLSVFAMRCSSESVWLAWLFFVPAGEFGNDKSEEDESNLDNEDAGLLGSEESSVCSQKSEGEEESEIPHSLYAT